MRHSKINETMIDTTKNFKRNKRQIEIQVFTIKPISEILSYRDIYLELLLFSDPPFLLPVERYSVVFSVRVSGLRGVNLSVLLDQQVTNDVRNQNARATSDATYFILTFLNCMMIAYSTNRLIGFTCAHKIVIQHNIRQPLITVPNEGKEGMFSQKPIKMAGLREIRPG